MVHTIILAVLLITSIIYNLLYKRQIRDFVRQLRFHGEEESNREIAAELKSRSIVDMQNELNNLLKLRTYILPMHLENSIPGSYSVVKVSLLCCLKL